MNKQHASRIGLAMLLAMAVVATAACSGQATIGNKISSEVSGYADDGDSAQARATYFGPANLTAVDNQTRSESTDPTANAVSGNAHAVPTNPGAPTLTADVAEAESRNKVTSVFTVTTDGNFVFDIDLDIDDIELVHEGTAAVAVQANVLDAQGLALPPTVNSGLAAIDFVFRPSAGNSHEVIINGDEANPDSTEPDGDYNQTLSGPNGGIDLTVGAYRIELVLNILVTAKILIGPDGRKHEAHVPAATATITLR